MAEKMHTGQRRDKLAWTAEFFTSLKVLCVRRSWWLNKDCNTLTSPAPPDIAVCLSHSPGLLNRGPGAQLSAESLFSLLDLWTATAQSGVPRAPSAGYWFSLLHLISNSSDLQLIRTSCAPSYIIVLRSLNLFP